MEDGEIVELYWRRDESAITETARKYGALCRTVAKGILDHGGGRGGVRQ